MKTIREIAARLRLNWMLKKYHSYPINLPHDMVNAERLLVCLPEGQRELTMIRQFLPDLSQVFYGSEIFLMASPGSPVYDIFPRKGYRIVTPTSKNVCWSGLAHRSYIEELKKNKYGMILDLNLRSNYFARSILLSFPRAVRIGQGDGSGLPYYNVEIKTRFIRDEKNIYKSIIETIENLKSSSVASLDEVR